MKLKFVPFRSFEVPFPMVSLFFEFGSIIFWPKTLGVLINSCFTHIFSLEGAMKLKFVPFRSSRDALSDGIFVF